MSQAAKKLVKGIDNQAHVNKCVNCKYFPFTVVCDKTAIDLIAPGFLSFKYLSSGLDHLFKNKKLASQLASRIELMNPS